MNNKVKFLRGTSDEYAVAEKDSDAIYFTTDDGKLYIGDKEVSGSDITIDDTLSDTSENPVQNKVVKQAIDNKADKTVATISADGLMSAEDKGKLDAFEITTTGGKLHDKDIATTDLIPTTLPANGGNAATVGGVGIANLRQITQTVINTLPAAPNGEGDFFVNRDEGDTSFPYQYGHLSIRYGSYTDEYVAIFRTTGNDNKIYYNTYLTDHWSGWQEISATPIKTTTFAGTTNSYGDMLLFNKSEKKIPLFVSINDSYCIPLLSGSSDYYVHIINVDNTVAANVSKSGTLYYSEFKAVIV